jgi:trehalose 6-phosphate synthase
MLPKVRVEVKKRHSFLRYGRRLVKVGHFPIGIDFEKFDKAAKSKEVAEAAWFLHENLQAKQLILGLDRLDYTKWIPERFRALECALEKYPDLQGNISLVQVLVPSRIHVPQYKRLKNMLDALTGRINGKFSRHGWVPIHYKYRRLGQVQLLGHYRACEIALVTPLRDGMNLVAKEYCASSVDNNGVLILSEFAGAADQLVKGALVVNPYDLEGTADAIYRAYQMETEERNQRMRSLRTTIKRNNVYRWVEWFLQSFRPGKTTLHNEMPGQNGEDQEVTNMSLWMSQTELNLQQV